MSGDSKNNDIVGKPGRYRYHKGKKGFYLIWWVLGALGYIGTSLIWLRNDVNWKAAGITMLFFVPLMYGLETLALYWGWWVYNEELLWGIRIGLIPLEEIGLVLVVVPAVVLIQALVMKVLFKVTATGKTHIKTGSNRS